MCLIPIVYLTTCAIKIFQIKSTGYISRLQNRKLLSQSLEKSQLSRGGYLNREKPKAKAVNCCEKSQLSSRGYQFRQRPIAKAVGVRGWGYHGVRIRWTQWGVVLWSLTIAVSNQAYSNHQWWSLLQPAYRAPLIPVDYK